MIQSDTPGVDHKPAEMSISRMLATANVVILKKLKCVLPAIRGCRLYVMLKTKSLREGYFTAMNGDVHCASRWRILAAISMRTRHIQNEVVIGDQSVNR